MASKALQQNITIYRSRHLQGLSIGQTYSDTKNRAMIDASQNVKRFKMVKNKYRNGDVELCCFLKFESANAKVAIPIDDLLFQIFFLLLQAVDLDLF
jgi:hypothetical protein